MVDTWLCIVLCKLVCLLLYSGCYRFIHTLSHSLAHPIPESVLPEGEYVGENTIPPIVSVHKEEMKEGRKITAEISKF